MAMGSLLKHSVAAAAAGGLQSSATSGTMGRVACGLGGAAGGSAGLGRISHPRLERETLLSIDDAVTRRVEGSLAALFSVEERPVLGEACVHPLSRRGGGTIGSEENLKSPTGLAIRGATPESGLPSLLYVADYEVHRILVFGADSGELLRSIGNGQGDRDGELNAPRHLLLRRISTGSWHLFVSDYFNSRIQVFDADTGAHVRSLGEGDLSSPGGMALLEPIAGSAQPVAICCVRGLGHCGCSQRRLGRSCSLYWVR